MRRAAFVVASAFVAALSACSLFTSLTGFSDGDAADAASDTALGPTDGSSGTDSTIAVDGGDAGEAGPSRSALYAAAVLADKPVGYWRLEETSGGVAKDESGHHNGKYEERPVLGQPGVAGSRSMKLARDSEARMLIESSDYSFPDSAANSVELWVITGEQRDYTWLGGTEKRVGGARNGWSLLVNATGHPLYEVWRPDGDGGSIQVRGLGLSGTPLPSGRFVHLVMTYDGTNARGYVDGVLTTTFPKAGLVPLSSQLMWGCRGDFAHCADDWSFDELAVYDVVLDITRIKAHYDLGK